MAPKPSKRQPHEEEKEAQQPKTPLRATASGTDVSLTFEQQQTQARASPQLWPQQAIQVPLHPILLGYFPLQPRQQRRSNSLFPDCYSPSSSRPPEQNRHTHVFHHSQLESQLQPLVLHVKAPAVAPTFKQGSNQDRTLFCKELILTQSLELATLHLQEQIRHHRQLRLRFKVPVLHLNGPLASYHSPQLVLLSPGLHLHVQRAHRLIP